MSAITNGPTLVKCKVVLPLLLPRFQVMSLFFPPKLDDLVVP